MLFRRSIRANIGTGGILKGTQSEEVNKAAK